MFWWRTGCWIIPSCSPQFNTAALNRHQHLVPAVVCYKYKYLSQVKVGLQIQFPLFSVPNQCMITNWELVRKLLMRGIQKWHCLSFPVWSFSSYDFLKYFFLNFGPTLLRCRFIFGYSRPNLALIQL